MEVKLWSHKIFEPILLPFYHQASTTAYYLIMNARYQLWKWVNENHCESKENILLMQIHLWIKEFWPMVRDIHIECSKQFKWNCVFGQSRPFNSIQCMEQDISLKSERKNPWFKPWYNIFCTHNQLCVPQYKVNV